MGNLICNYLQITFSYQNIDNLTYGLWACNINTCNKTFIKLGTVIGI